ncbi:hypothetical protein AB1Y20_007691 [Prymnesium parvum]|uniref:Uncharacterized protein n=1 Tax=Prymnesium parvum TaxID=97485 RepID=A0AB34IYS0_PRYPA
MSWDPVKQKAWEVIDTLWVNKRKRDESGKVCRFKARCTLRGDQQNSKARPLLGHECPPALTCAAITLSSEAYVQKICAKYAAREQMANAREHVQPADKSLHQAYDHAVEQKSEAVDKKFQSEYMSMIGALICTPFPAVVQMSPKLCWEYLPAPWRFPLTPCFWRLSGC